MTQTWPVTGSILISIVIYDVFFVTNNCSCYIPTKLACRTRSNLSFQCCPHSMSPPHNQHVLLQSIQPIFIKFATHQNQCVIYPPSKYNWNRAKIEYFLLLEKKRPQQLTGSVRMVYDRQVWYVCAHPVCYLIVRSFLTIQGHNCSIEASRLMYWFHPSRVWH